MIARPPRMAEAFGGRCPSAQDPGVPDGSLSPADSARADREEMQPSALTQLY